MKLEDYEIMCILQNANIPEDKIHMFPQVLLECFEVNGRYLTSVVDNCGTTDVLFCIDTRGINLESIYPKIMEFGIRWVEEFIFHKGLDQYDIKNKKVITDIYGLID